MVMLVKSLRAFIRALLVGALHFAWIRRTGGAFTRRIPFLHARLVALSSGPAARAIGKVRYPMQARDDTEARLPVDARRIYRLLSSQAASDRAAD